MTSIKTNRQCIILVGGIGSRLGALTAEVPKPMLPIAGRPFIEYLIDHVARFGFNDIVLLAGYHGEMIAKHFAAWIHRNQNITIRVVQEPHPLGTGGALVSCRDILAPEFLLTNGDTYFNFDIDSLTTWTTKKPWLCRLALRRVEDTERYGVVELGHEGKINGFTPRPKRAGSGLINSGVYWVRREIALRLPAGKCSLEDEVLPALAEENILYGAEYDGFFIDIGMPADYRKAQRLLPRESV